MAKQINTDEEFKLKRQARHRLIGAVALMVGIVIFLPMVFDSEPDVNVGNIELRIPDKTEVPEFSFTGDTGRLYTSAGSGTVVRA
jgi:DedD protein